MFKKVGIVGLGLIGGSIAKVLKQRLKTETIVAFNRNDDVLKDAYNEGVIDLYTTEINNLFSGCDVVFICTPVNTIFEYAKKLTQFINTSCIVSDVGSTKGIIYNEMKVLSNKFNFIGGHPMTGSEKFRYSASREHLFENAYYMLTPGDNVEENTVASFKKGIEAFGAIPVVVSPQEHDYIVASISHVPHIIASALCKNVQSLDTEEKHMKLLVAGGFKDITRIASGSPEIWETICMDNKEEILKALDNLESIIKNAKTSIAENDAKSVFNYFDEARMYRNSFSTVTPGAFSKRYEIVIDVIDKPGSIAIIAVLFSSNNINIKNMSIVNSREQAYGALQIAFDNEDHCNKSISLLREMNYDVHMKE